jgi:hypothetical protein
MKLFVLLSLVISVVGCNAATDAQKKTLPINNVEESVKSEQAQAKAVGAAEEDCDDKAKKPIEIKEETISLSGNTGCTLDETKPGL